MDLTAEQRAILSLCLLPEVGPAQFFRLVSCFGSAEEVLAASLSELASVEGVTAKLAGRLTAAAGGADAEHEFRRAGELGVEIITYLDSRYPESLKTLTDVPPVIYVRGDVSVCSGLGIALVGTRRPTQYGRSVASSFSRQLAGSGIVTVSGLARGIDTEVHEATLAAGGRTIAVLGNGLNRHYPPENRKLEEKIVRNGALVSEFPLDAEPDRKNFPRRNRIISGLALATIVVEADIQSGALITARYSAEQGKDVFAVPGPIFSRVSRGPHHLVKSGAHLVESVDDIMQEVAPLAQWWQQKKPSVPEKQECGGLDVQEGKIIDILDNNTEGVSIEHLIAALGTPSSKLAAVLLNLELKGMIRSLPGKLYARNR